MFVPSSGERLREIVRVLAKYGFGHIYNTRVRSQKKEQDPKNLRKAFEELGPGFIKIGQILSTRRDILPMNYIEELAKLQDKAPNFPFEAAKQIFVEEFGQEIHEVFEILNEKPLASASVAQVHRGRLLTGEEVIVKVQRPQMEKQFLQDIELFIRIVDRAPNIFKDFLVDPKEAFEEIRKTSKREMDFRNEANAINKFKNLNKDIACVGTPKVVVPYSSKRILVEEYIEGYKILDIDHLLQAGYVQEDIAQKLLLSFLSQVFRDGFFHADPHPGNLLIKEGQIYFIDFGIVGELSLENRENLNQLLKAIVFKDLDQLMKTLLKMGVQKKRIDRARFYEDLSYLVDTYLTTNFSNIEIGTLIADVLDVTRKHGLSMPSDFTLLVRALTVLEGVVLQLAPDVNIVQIAKEYLKESDNFKLFESVSKEKLLLQTAQFAKGVAGLPLQFASLVENLNNGRTKIKLDLVNMDDKWTGLNKMVNRVVFALIVSALILSSALIIFAGESRGISWLGIIFFLAAGFLGLWLLISIIRSERI